MRIETLTFYSLPYVVVIASSMALTQAIPLDALAGFQPGSTKVALSAGQIVNRLAKSDRLPVKRAQPSDTDEAPARARARCKPPIDVLGRCFADLKTNQAATPDRMG